MRQPAAGGYSGREGANDCCFSSTIGGILVWGRCPSYAALQSPGSVSARWGWGNQVLKVIIQSAHDPYLQYLCPRMSIISMLDACWDLLCKAKGYWEFGQQCQCQCPDPEPSHQSCLLLLVPGGVHAHILCMLGTDPSSGRVAAEGCLMAWKLESAPPHPVPAQWQEGLRMELPSLKRHLQSLILLRQSFLKHCCGTANSMASTGVSSTYPRLLLWLKGPNCRSAILNRTSSELLMFMVIL